MQPIALLPIALGLGAGAWLLTRPKSAQAGQAGATWNTETQPGGGIPVPGTDVTVPVPTGGGVTAQLPPELINPQLAVSTAIASGSVAVMRQTAAQLRAAGYTRAADDLDNYADQFEASQATTTYQTPPVIQTSSAPAATTTLPIPTVPTIPVDPLAQSSKALNDHLRGTSKGKENQGMVRAYQLAAGQTADGKYGPSTALRIAQAGVIPVKPFYWPGPDFAAYQQAKQDYSTALSAYALQDPTRASQWQAAAKV